MRHFLSAIFFFLLGLNLSCDASQKPLIVGMELAYPPFEMSDPKGNPSGISVDIAQALGRSLSREVEIRNLPFDGLIPSLKTGKIDLILSSMTATQEREVSIDFSIPYLKTGLCLLIGRSSSIQNSADLEKPGVRVAVKQGTTGHLHATNHLRSARTLVLDRESACVLEVVQGKVDAFLYDQMSVLKHWQQNPVTTRALLSPIQEESWAIGIRKGNDGLRNSVNEFLKDFSQRGGFRELAEKWLPDQKAAFEKLGVPFVF
jgi:polar amino acid transport system substrate-binding protein